MIEVKNVSFQYSDSRYGVQNINLTVADGECIAITGESGCGKTTLTRLINGLAPAYYHGNKSGSILITGRNISNLPLYKIGRIVGSIFQDPQRQFFSSQLAGEVAFACENYGFLQDEIVNRTDISIKKNGSESPTKHFSECSLRWRKATCSHCLGIRSQTTSVRFR